MRLGCIPSVLSGGCARLSGSTTQQTQQQHTDNSGVSKAAAGGVRPTALGDVTRKSERPEGGVFLSATTRGRQSTKGKGGSQKKQTEVPSLLQSYDIQSGRNTITTHNHNHITPVQDTSHAEHASGGVYWRVP